MIKIGRDLPDILLFITTKITAIEKMTNCHLHSCSSFHHVINSLCEN